MSATPSYDGLLLSGASRGQLDAEASLHDSIGPRGHIRLARVYDIRVFAESYNRARRDVGGRAAPVQPAKLGSVARLDEIARCLMARYRADAGEDVFERAESWLEHTLGRQTMAAARRVFWETFPPEDVRRGECSLEAYLGGEPPPMTVDLVAVWLLNANPAVGSMRDLFDDGPLEDMAYEPIMEQLGAFFGDKPGLGRPSEPLWTLLRSHIDHGGDTLDSQLKYLRRRVGHLLGDRLMGRLLTTLDVLREGQKAARFSAAAGPGPVEPPAFGGLDDQPSRFSSDLGWMPQLVLMAKNVHVWLTQLSRREGRDIERIDQIPDAELDRLAEAGISGLWLIGLWQRSPASGRIKALSGSPDAVSSAYSIESYRVADDLGGQPAWERLRRRARDRGIRMAADMVPNHMGITSEWVYEHPDWLLGRQDVPFGSYRFDGPDLSADDQVGIYVEDHYYDRSDAAVVFKRVDRPSGQTRYIYHGNDGTSMPWNDTAQIDYLNEKAREAVIEQILEVAKKASVIRFDAAMTLVKKHIQRLWYPQPGSGGAIPSRAESGMSAAEFDRIMPREFWAEVVDRVAQEAPDTLLLAEAFWMLEGYFVRSLGMHRVYNSAFMHMLSQEDNAGYRQVMKKTLKFDPQILRRYVNFMNNPDEETAIAQFGDGEKYVGVCTLMATMPGLPMFGHGQVEGLVEKYGMDFNEPRLDETPDEQLVERHRRQIFPLLRQRQRFAGVEHFLLYDFRTADGGVDENVFAYSNRLGERKSLVVYHNRYAETAGWVRESAAYREGAADGDDDGQLVRKSLVDGLDMSVGPDVYVALRDQVSQSVYLRASVELAEQGFFVELGAYDRHVFVDIREIRDTDDGRYRRLAERLDGRGVDSLDAELRRMRLEPLHARFSRVLTPDMASALAAGRADKANFDALRGHVVALGEAVAEFGGPSDPDRFADAVEADFLALLDDRAASDAAVAESILAESTLAESTADQAEVMCADGWSAVLWAWAVMRPIGGREYTRDNGLRARSLVDEWTLEQVLTGYFERVELDANTAARAAELLAFGLSRQPWLADPETWTMPPAELLDTLLDDSDARAVLGVNRHGGTLWYNGDTVGLMMDGVARFCALYHRLGADPVDEPSTKAPVSAELVDSIKEIYEASKHAEFQVQNLRDILAR